MTRVFDTQGSSSDVEADNDASVGNQRTVGALVIVDLKAAFDHCDGSRSMRQNSHDLRLVDQFGAGHADMNVDNHCIQRLTKRRRDRQRVMPKRIPKGPASCLRRVSAADVGAHADLEHHTLLRHIRSAKRSLGVRDGPCITGRFGAEAVNDGTAQHDAQMAAQWSPRLRARDHCCIDCGNVRRRKSAGLGHNRISLDLASCAVIQESALRQNLRSPSGSWQGKQRLPILFWRFVLERLLPPCRLSTGAPTPSPHRHLNHCRATPGATALSMSNYNQSLNDRLGLAAQAKKSMLEKFKKSLILDDPAKIESRRQREAIVAARAEREAQREAARQQREAEVARQALIAAEAAAAAKRAMAEQAAREAAEQEERQVALLAEQKMARDVRYAARKAAKKERRRGY